MFLGNKSKSQWRLLFTFALFVFFLWLKHMHAHQNPASINALTSKRSSCPHTEAVFRRTTNGYARICFMKNSMNAEVIAAFFQHGHFRIDHAFELPMSIVHHLELKERQVSAGLYKLRTYKDFFIIDLDPSMKSQGSS